jgi:hypothetical protein
VKRKAKVKGKGQGKERERESEWEWENDHLPAVRVAAVLNVQNIVDNAEMGNRTRVT